MSHKSTKSLSFVSWNCNSISGKTHHLDCVIHHDSPDIIALCETKLNPTILDSEILTGYTIYRRDRTTGLGGGVLLAISDLTNIKETNIYSDPVNEIISLDLDYHGYTFVFACYYRRPSIKNVSDILDWYERQINPNILIVGDFNLPEIDWATKSLKSNRDHTMHETFLDFVDVNNLSQPITFPTHKLGNTLDLIVTNMDIDGPDIDPSPSDHFIISATIPVHVDNIPLDTRISKLFYKFEQADLPQIELQTDKLHDSICQKTESNQPIELIWNEFKNSILETSKQYIPNYPSKSRKKHWITRRTLTEINRRKRKKKKLRKHYSLANLIDLQTQSDYCKKLVDDDYNRYINTHICNKLDEGNSKPLFKFISNKKGQNNTIKCVADSSSDQDIAESFVDAFSSVFTLDDGFLPSLQKTIHSQSDAITVTPHGVLNLLLELDPTKGPGPDNLSPALLKFLSPYIYKTIAKIFNYSLLCSQVPIDWKKAHVVPIHKKGDRSVALNYRPISLTSIICKTLEHIIAHNIHSYLDKHNLLFDHQHGFRSGHGCDTQLLNTITDFIDSFDSSILTDLIVLDFSKAFDVVSHPKLIHKLTALGIHPQTVLWIRDWLSNRTHQVTVNGVISTSRSVTSGVPQGSVLGPLLFLTFINDMPIVTQHSKLKLFADDSLLYNQIKTQQDTDNLQSDLNNLITWSETWQMKFNPQKCETMRISRISTQPQTIPHNYHINSTPLTPVQTVKYLGIHIDDKLSFTTHVKEVCKKATNVLHLLMRSLKKANSKTRETAYKSVCRPILEYATIIWSPHKQKLIKLLEAINRKAFRWCHRKKKHDHISDLMIANCWSTLVDRRECFDMKMYHKIITGLVAVDPQRFSLHQSDTYNTRRGGIPTFINTNTQRFSFKHRIFRKIAG